MKLSNFNLLRLVEISTALFIAMKICYWLAKDYNSEYWYVIYYLPLYFMLMSLFLLIRSYMITKEHKLYFLYWVCYFGAMALLHIVCLFDISLYGRLVSGVGYYGIGALAFSIGFTFMVFKFQNYGRRKV